MGLPQRAGSPASAFPALPPGVADAAGHYQRLREIEKGHLALMARHNLLADWTPEIRETVIEARKHIQEANVAREKFRALVREIVMTLRAERMSLSGVLRHARSLLQMLEQSGSIQNDGGWLEADGRSKTTSRARDERRDPARTSDARAPLRGRFGDEPRSPMTDLEDVVVAPLRIAGIDDLVVRRLGLDLYGEPVAFAAFASDLNHSFILRRSSARLLNGGPGTAGEKPGTTLTRALDGARDAFRQTHRTACVRFEHQGERTPLAIERREELRPAVGSREHSVYERLQRALLGRV
jgi:hypothetical protein